MCLFLYILISLWIGHFCTNLVFLLDSIILFLASLYWSLTIKTVSNHDLVYFPFYDQYSSLVLLNKYLHAAYSIPLTIYLFLMACISQISSTSLRICTCLLCLYDLRFDHNDCVVLIEIPYSFYLHNVPCLLEPMWI